MAVDAIKEDPNFKGLDLVPDLDTAIDFLKSWPSVPVLSAVRTHPQTGAVGAFLTKAFPAPTDWDAVRAWIAEHQCNKKDRKGWVWSNIYFTVNNATPQDKKVSREDIQSMVALHVDSDCAPGEAQDVGIKRIVGMFEKYGRKNEAGEFLPMPPSEIVISGGGAQAFWRLQAPEPINGSVDICETLKLYNLHLEQDLSGDHCHNIDRIMRVPGTVNIPKADKIAKGRKPALASWYSSSARRYSLLDFEKAPPEAPPNRYETGFQDTGQYSRVAADDPRLDKLEPKWKLLAQKGDTENKYCDVGGKTDRSKMAIAFVTAALRAKIEPQVVASILMDPAWEIGACIRDKGGTVQRHLRRTMERGAKFVEDDFSLPPVLKQGDWEHAAELFIIRVWPNLIFHNGSACVPQPGGYYLEVEEGTVRSAMRKFLNSAKTPGEIGDDGKPKLKPFAPTNTDINELYGCVSEMYHTDRDALAPPTWLDTDGGFTPPARECVVCNNGILHVPTRRLIDHTANFFTFNAVTFPYDAQATCPLWLKTLEQYWPPAPTGEPAKEIDLLQEIMGYLLLPDNKLQKIFSIIGPTRSGKGTIAHVIEALLGANNCVGPSLDSFGNEYGLWPLVGKTCAIIGETILSPRADKVAVTRMLKSLWGGDKQTNKRQKLSYWSGVFLVRILMLSNQMIDLADDSKALQARMVPLRMQISWEGKEDEDLGARLEAELPGIFLWALQGYDRLYGPNGRKFTMPVSSLEVKEDYGRASSPMPSFIEDCLQVSGDHEHDREPEDLVYDAYTKWCERNNTRALPKTKMLNALSAATGMSKVKRLRAVVATHDGNHHNQDRARVLTGLRLVKVVHAAGSGAETHGRAAERSARGEEPPPAEIPF